MRMRAVVPHAMETKNTNRRYFARVAVVFRSLLTSSHSLREEVVREPCTFKLDLPCCLGDKHKNVSRLKTRQISAAKVTNNTMKEGRVHDDRNLPSVLQYQCCAWDQTLTPCALKISHSHDYWVYNPYWPLKLIFYNLSMLLTHCDCQLAENIWNL